MAANDDTKPRGIRFERRGGSFVLVVTEQGATAKEIALSAMEVLALSRLVLPETHHILRSPSGTGRASARYQEPVREFVLNLDQLRGLVLLTLEDATGANLTYSIQPHQARALAESLLRWADRAEQPSSPPTKQ